MSEAPAPVGGLAGQCLSEDTAIERDRKSSYDHRVSQDIPARPARRRPTRKPRRILGLWARLTLLGMAIIVLGLAAIGLVAKAIRPYREAGLQSRQLSETQRQIAALDEQNTSLKRRIAYLKTPDGVVSEARKMGYLKPGEIPFVVEGVTSPAASDDAPAPAAPSRLAPPSRMRRLWHRLTGH